jgi:hypothetical protein
MIEATCDNLAAALHKADTWAKRYREVYTAHRDDELVATATHKHTSMVLPPCLVLQPARDQTRVI